MILLDTNVCIRILRGRKDALEAFSANAGNVAVPFMALGELYYGAARSDDPKLGKSLVDRFAKILPVVHSSQVATGNIRHFSRFEGLDLLLW